MSVAIKIKKWLGIEEADIVFDRPFSIVQGTNASGKSSVKQGFDYVFGAKIRGVASKDRQMLGRDGEKFSIEVDVNGNKFKATKSQVPKEDSVADTLNVSRKALRFCTEPALFLTATQKELKSLLSEVLQLDFDWKAEAIKRGCDKGAVTGLPDDIREALKVAKDTRAGLGGEKGDEGVGRPTNRAKTHSPERPDDPDVVLSQGTTKASEVDLDELGAGLRELYEQKDILVQERARIRTLTDEERRTIGVEIERLEKELRDAPNEDELRPRATEARRERDALTKRKAEAAARRESITEEREKWDKIFSLKLCAKCKKLVERELDVKVGRVKAIDDNEKKMDAQIEKLTGEIVRIDQDLSRPSGAVILEKMKSLQERLDRAGNPKDAEKLDTEIDRLKDRIDVGQKARDVVRDYYTAMNAYKDACENFEEDKKEWELWNKVCQEIPDIQGTAVQDGLTPFRKIIADQKILDGEICLEDDLTIVYNGRPFSMASKSEQYIIALAPFFAVQELFGFPFCQVDDGDNIVSDELKERLFDTLIRMSEQKQVIFYQAKPEQTLEQVQAAIELAEDAGIGLYHAAERTVKRIA